MNAGRFQSGFVDAKIFFVVMLSGLIVYSAFKVIPAYMDNAFIVESLKAAGMSEPPLKSKSTREIKGDLGKILSINNIRTVSVDDIEVVREKDKVLVNINYEVRSNLFYNIDIVVVFENQLNSLRPDQCCKPFKK